MFLLRVVCDISLIVSVAMIVNDLIICIQMLFAYLLSCFREPLSYFLFQTVLHDWCNKGHGMCYPVWYEAYKIIKFNTFHTFMNYY